MFLLSFSAYAAEIKMDKSKIIVKDGDTISYNHIIIRVLGVDTPEIANNFNIPKSQYLGKEASLFTKNLFEKAKDISYFPAKKDRYGRMLAHIMLDGELLSIKIIEAGLGYETISTYGDNGFPEFGKRIKLAAAKTGKANFINPLYWRRKNIKKEKSLKDKKSVKSSKTKKRAKSAKK